MLNADPHELAKFSELAHRWWDPDSEFRPLHQINPLRLDWIDGLAPLAGKRVARRRLRRRHPGRSDGAHAAPTCSASTRRPSRCKVAQLHALEAATPRRRVPRGRGRGAGGRAARAASTSSPAWRCSSTCPDPASVVARLRPRWSKPGGWVFFSTINRNAEGVPVRHRRRRVRAEAAAARARTSTRSSSARASSRGWCRGAGARLRGHARHGIQPAHAALLAVGRHERQLPDRVPQAGMMLGAPTRRPCCSTSTAR